MRRGLTIAAGALALATLGPGSAAAAAAKLRSKLSGARAPAGQLDRTRTVVLPGGAIVYQLQQRVGGIPVLAGATVVNDAPGAPPELVADSSRPGIQPPPSPRVGEESALRIASRSVASRRLMGHRSARLAIEPGDGGTLVWRVEIPSAQPLGDFEVLVDALSGKVLRTRNLIRDFRTGHARLYDPNPVVEHGGFAGLKSDHNDQNTPLLNSLRLPVKLPDIARHQRCLRGRFAHALRGHDRRETCRRSLRWNRIKRANDRFEALMAYYHVDRAQRYIHTLGFSHGHANGVNDSGIDDRRQTVIVDPFKADNSFYLPSDRKIRYGSGGVDDAEDADVILHEYGHAMQDSQAPSFLFGHSLEATSVSEGSADYWAAAMSSFSPGTAEIDDVCIFEWDGTVWGDLFESDSRFCGRRADNPKTLSEEKADPIDCSSSDGHDEHCVGTVWSSALWKLRGEVGNDPAGHSIMDRDYLAAQFFYTANENFKKAANHLLCADSDLYPLGSPGDCQGQNFATIHTEMVARGFL